MRRTDGAILVAALLAGCTSREAAREDAVMDRIEQNIVMPRGARSLGSYARYYAPDSDGLINGIYIAPELEKTEPGAGCADVTVNFTLQAVPCDIHPTPTDEIRAGQRQWRSNPRKLPLITDGGCDIILSLYSQRQRAFTLVRCAGAG